MADVQSQLQEAKTRDETTNEDAIKKSRDQIAAILLDRESLQQHANRLFQQADIRRAGALRFEELRFKGIYPSIYDSVSTVYLSM